MLQMLFIVVGVLLSMLAFDFILNRSIKSALTVAYVWENISVGLANFLMML